MRAAEVALVAVFSTALAGLIAWLVGMAGFGFGLSSWPGLPV